MQFLYPAFLIALLTLAIPVIIHLFYFRRFKKVYFTNIRFLKEVKEETSSRSKLRNILVLLSRLLALGLLVFAFAQPFLKKEANAMVKGQKAVSVFVDNSFSMSALSQDVPLLDKAKQRAREIVAAFGPEDRFQILTMDFEGRHQRMVSKEDALTLIDEITISPAVRQLSTVMSRQKSALGKAGTDNQMLYQVSDFQQSSTDLQNIQDTTLEVNLVPLQAVQERNISIDSAWFDAPVPMVNQVNELIIRLKNHSNETAENIRLSLKYDGQTKPVGTLSIPANTEVLDTVNMSVQHTGWHLAELAITDYPVQFDDKYYFTFNVDEEIKVLSIHDGTPDRYLRAALDGLPYFSFAEQSSQQLDYAQLGGNQLIVLNDLRAISSGLGSELENYVAGGGNLLVFPGPDANLQAYQSFLSGFPANEPQAFDETERAVGRVNTEEFIFRDVYENASSNLKLPATTANYTFSRFNSRPEERLLTYRDGSTYLAKYQVGQGNLYVCAAPLNEKYNDLVRNGEIFIPMLYKMAISSGRTPRIAYTIGQDETLEADYQPNSSEIVYKLRGQEEEFIPEQRVLGAKVYMSVNDQVKTAGFYQLFLEQPDTLRAFAFNYDRTESALQYFAVSELKDRVGENVQVIEVLDNAVLTARIEEQARGTVFWRWCLIAALVFLLIETLILRFWKTAP